MFRQEENDQARGPRSAYDKSLKVQEWASFTWPLAILTIMIVYILLIDYSTRSIQLSTTHLMRFAFSTFNYDLNIHLLYRQTHVCSVVSEWYYDSEYSSSSVEANALPRSWNSLIWMFISTLPSPIPELRLSSGLVSVATSILHYWLSHIM